MAAQTKCTKSSHMTPLEVSYNDFLILFGQITIITMIFPVVVALIFKSFWNRPLKVIFLYVFVSFVLNLLENIFIWATTNYYESIKPFLDYFELSNTIFFTILYYLKDFLLLGRFYSLIFPFVPLNRSIYKLGWILSVAVIINFLFIEGYQNFGTFNPGADAIFSLVLPLVYLWVSQQHSLRIPLRKNPYFWISLGLLFPKALSLFIFFTGDFLYQSDYILYVKILLIRNLFEIIGLALITIGFIYARYTRLIRNTRRIGYQNW